MMSAKRTLRLIVFVLFVAGVVVCVSSCKDSQLGGLWFVDDVQPSASRPTPTGLVVVTHGWIEEAKGDWPQYMAVEINSRVEPNEWVCGYFDWSKGAKTLNPTKAAKYARDVAGPRLAEEITKISRDWRYIHLIGHSGGCWAISEAAKILAVKTKADIHLTFFDAYVPVGWQQGSLAKIQPAADVNYWADHYYTRDYTLGWTQQDLDFAHNVDVTEIDQKLKDHNFPWKWYHATITGKYPKGHFLNNRKLVFVADGVEYGFARSREAADSNSWAQSLKMPIGNKAIKLKKNNGK